MRVSAHRRGVDRGRVENEENQTGYDDATRTEGLLFAEPGSGQEVVNPRPMASQDQGVALKGLAGGTETAKAFLRISSLL